MKAREQGESICDHAVMLSAARDPSLRLRVTRECCHVERSEASREPGRETLRCGSEPALNAREWGDTVRLIADLLWFRRAVQRNGFLRVQKRTGLTIDGHRASTTIDELPIDVTVRRCSRSDRLHIIRGGDDDTIAIGLRLHRVRYVEQLRTVEIVIGRLETLCQEGKEAVGCHGIRGRRIYRQ